MLWRAVTSEKRKPYCLKIVHKIAGKEKESIRQLAFLLFNIIAKVSPGTIMDTDGTNFCKIILGR